MKLSKSSSVWVAALALFGCVVFVVDDSNETQVNKSTPSTSLALAGNGSVPIDAQATGKPRTNPISRQEGQQPARISNHGEGKSAKLTLKKQLGLSDKKRHVKRGAPEDLEVAAGKMKYSKKKYKIVKKKPKYKKIKLEMYEPKIKYKKVKIKVPVKKMKKKKVKAYVIKKEHEHGHHMY